MDLLLKLMAHRRAELDWQDRRAEAARGRLEDAVEPPGPLVLTLVEQREMLKGSRWFLEWYIPRQQERQMHADSLRLLDALELQAREEIERLEVETNS
ncbi:MAG TPA: hypothetical protein VFI90_10200 [Rubrobacter sp.]|nr:hypothetical protein [Rubrobacter sp.]